VPRVAIVTGGGTGIGAAAARLLAANGLRVALVGRRPEPLEDVRAELGDAAVAALPSLRASEDAAVANVSSSVGSIVKPGSMLGLPASAGG
jgi:meso-butanediol dehydrogenase/(S,S)-butanediol dehydrogenase/diacetyl reductase